MRIIKSNIVKELIISIVSQHSSGISIPEVVVRIKQQHKVFEQEVWSAVMDMTDRGIINLNKDLKLQIY